MRYSAITLWSLWMGLCAAVEVAHAQQAEVLKNVHRVYVGGFGTLEGGEDLRKELAAALTKKKAFELASRPEESDAIAEGRAELWIRGYHSLSPRARKNKDYAEPVYTGYLSVQLRGKDHEILWSYFADPRRVTIHDVKRDLVDEVVTRLKLDHEQDAAQPSTAISQQSDHPVTLRGGGGTFALPIYDEWFKTYHAKHAAITFSYSSVGSGAGLTLLDDKQLDFAGSDIAPEALPRNTRDSNNFFPTVGGAVVLLYRLPGFAGELRLTADVIAGIFSGAIRRWDDAKLQALNPSAALPDAPIRVFHRSDSSGSTFALMDYLAKAGSVWGRAMGAKPEVNWPVGEGLQGNEALANAVAATPFSFGYGEFIYAFNHHLSFASVKNRSGRFVAPDLLSIMAAANWSGDSPADSDLSIVNSPEPSGYPISTMTWMVVPRALAKEKRSAIADFLNWLLTAGQRQCSGLGYAPLPRNLQDRELNAVAGLH